MRNVSTIASAGIIAGALVLSACSSPGSPSATGSVPQASMQMRGPSSIADKHGIDVRYAGSIGRAFASRVEPAKGKIEKDLFVSDGGATVYLFKNKSYQPAGTITDGLSDIDGVWVDKAGNAYVANVGAKTVTEYAPGGSSPICTYSAGLVDPVDVTTDAKGNVYVVDFNDLNNPGSVYEFAQCQNTAIKQFKVPQGPEDAAVDSKGDVFVSFFNANFNGGFEEFPKGKTTGTFLTATVGSPGGIALDKKGDIIADDQEGSIDVIAPPYSSATTLVSGLIDPFHVALSKNEKVLFNANAGNPQSVTIYSYPAGSLTNTLDSSNGLDGVEGVSDSPNAVF